VSPLHSHPLVTGGTVLRQRGTEVLGLKWQDVNWLETINVERGVVNRLSMMWSRDTLPRRCSAMTNCSKSQSTGDRGPSFH